MFDNIIKSVSESQAEIMTSIIWLYCKKGIEIDLTYGKGGIWRGVEAVPRRRFDLNPSDPETEKADVLELPLKSGSVYSVLFDPPFIAGGGTTGKIGKRYGHFIRPKGLSDFYEKALGEIYRILKINGWLIFKCMDFCNARKNWFFHCHIFNLAAGRGFFPKDLFILKAKTRVRPHNFRPETQQYARKYHCYFWVFKKTKADYFTWTH